MSLVIAVTFANELEASRLRHNLMALELAGKLRLDDWAVVITDQDGTIHFNFALDRGLNDSSDTGLVQALVEHVFRGAGLTSSAPDKALLKRIDERFVSKVRDEAQPGTSALFLILRDAAALLSIQKALRTHTATLYKVELPPDATTLTRRGERGRE